MMARRCKNDGSKNGNEHELRLIDVHLKSMPGTTSYSPLHGAGQGLNLVKVFECKTCGDRLEVREEVE